MLLPNIKHDSLTMDEIRNALNSGKGEITHTDAIQVPGWSGTGYIIIDPESGSGAYKIAGGANGSFLSGVSLGVSVGVMLTLSYLTGGMAGLIAAVILISQIALPVYVFNMSVYGDGGKLENCFKTGIATGLAGTGILSVLQAAGVAGAVAAAGGQWLTDSLTGAYDSMKSCI